MNKPWNKISSGFLAGVLLSSSLALTMLETKEAFASTEVKQEKVDAKGRVHATPQTQSKAVKGIPEASASWRYVTDKTADWAQIWSYGIAYGVNKNTPGKAYMKDYLDTKNVKYTSNYQKLQKNDFLKKTKICILFRPGCPYSKTYLPQFKRLADESQANVLLIDLGKYQAASLLPFYDVLNQGCASPTILYQDKEGSLKGATACHSAQQFADILTDCGYTTPNVPAEGDEYTREDQYQREMLAEVNRIRIENGLLPLSLSKELTKAANVRAKETYDYKIEHVRPKDDKEVSYTTIFSDLGIKGPNLFGENLCAGPAVATPYGAMDAWMNSRPHRENILRANYSHLGIGHYVNNENNNKFHDYWTQLFSGTCKEEDFRLNTKMMNVPKGVDINEMNIEATVHCSTHGETSLPVIDAMVTGYDKNKVGEQNVTVHYGKQTAQLLITVGDIEPTTLTAAMVDLPTTAAAYNGRAQMPAVQVRNATGEYPLMEGFSYDVRYENNINVGKARVTVTGKGNYKGSVTKEFAIQSQDIQKAKVYGLEKAYEYTGQAQKPPFQLTSEDGKPLYEGTDYTVEYQDNTGELIKKPGKAVEINQEKPGKIIIRGKGNYSGTKELSFQFKMSPVQQKAETLAFVIGPTSAYSSLTAMLDQFKAWQTTGTTLAHKTRFKKQMENTYEALIEYSYRLGSGKEDFDLSGSFNSKKEQLEQLQKNLETKKGYNELMTCALSPQTAELVNEWIAYVQKERKVDVQQQVLAPKVEGLALTGVQTEGLEALATEKGTEKLQVTLAQPQQELSVNSALYDVNEQVPMNIQLQKNGESTTLTQPLTVTMDMPKTENPKAEWVVLYYPKVTRSTEPQEIKVNQKDGKLSFTTSQVGDYVLTQKLPQYFNATPAQPNNNPKVSGVSFGEAMDEGPGQPQAVRAYQNKKKETMIQWQKEMRPSWDLQGYRLAYAQNQEMKGASTRQVALKEVQEKDGKCEYNLGVLPAGTYYLTVSNVAAPKNQSDITELGTSDKALLVVEGKEVPLETKYAIKAQKSDNGKIDVVSQAKAGEKVKIQAQAKAGYKVDRVLVTGENGQAQKVDKVGSTYEFTMPEQAVSVLALYQSDQVEAVKKDHKVNFPADAEYGEVTSNVGTQSSMAEAGMEVEFSAKADLGYKVDQVIVTTKSGKQVQVTEKDGKYHFTMPDEEVTVKVHFVKEEVAHAVTVEKTSHGEVSADETSAKVGTTVQVSAKANPGYKVDQVIVTTKSGKQVQVTEKDGKYHFTMPDEEVTVKIHFVKASLAVQVEKGKFAFNVLKDAFIYNSQGEKIGAVKKNQVCQAKEKITCAGKVYYHVYTSQAEGYVTATAVKTMPCEKIAQHIKMEGNVPLYSDLALTKKRNTAKDQRTYYAKYAYEKADGSKINSIYIVNSEGQLEWLGYTAAKHCKDLVAQKAKYIATAKKEYPIWGNLYFTKKVTTSTVGKNYQVKYEYHYNKATYASLYNKDGSWLGYINTAALQKQPVAQVKACDKKVSITKKKAKQYFAIGSVKSVKKGQNFAVKEEVKVGKASYYHIYTNKDAGYIAKNDAKELSAKKINQRITLTRDTALYRDISCTDQRRAGKGKRAYMAKYAYTTATGRQIYSLYVTNKAGKDEWQGYVAEKYCQPLKAKKVNYKIKVTKKYPLWHNLYFTKKVKDLKLGERYQVKYEYHYNNATYASLYDNKGKWRGYVNTGGVKRR